jgi:formate-dependent nitrite reductase cytochrome c552 subunit
MRKLSYLMASFAILIAGALIMSCEGPQGPAGTDGQDGAPGADGADGQNAAETCTQCHSDDQVIVTKSRQYANSGHNTGHTSGYTNRSFGPTYNCAACHTSQGFLDNLVGASNTPYADVTQPNCYTCHKVHDTYTEADWALTSGGIVTPLAPNSSGLDLGTGNQCVSCHQSTGRYLAVDSLWADFDLGTTTVTIDGSLSRAGVHHAPNYNTLKGTDMFEFSGDAFGSLKDHVVGAAAKGCVTCHMNDGFGDLTGHSMAMTYDWHGEENYHWPASCEECHDPDGAVALDAVVAAIATEIDGLMTQLYDLLIAADIIYPEGDDDEFLMKPGVFSTTLTAAHVNYNIVREDRSHGFHNPEYVRTVLTNTIAKVQALP